MRKSLPIFISLFFIATMSVAAMPSETAPETEISASSAGVVNINTADAAQLSLLPRIGEKIAQRIVDYRTEHGGFRSVDELQQVEGIGEKRFETLREGVTP